MTQLGPLFSVSYKVQTEVSAELGSLLELRILTHTAVGRIEFSSLWL